MADIPALITGQIGKETTWGTAVAPTAKLHGLETLRIRPKVQAERIKDMRGSLAPGYTADIKRVFGEGEIGGAVLYEDLPYWLDALFGEATPSGAGPYVYAYEAPLTAVPTSPRLMTLAGGQGSNVYCLTGALLNGLTISGKTGEKLMFSAPLLAKSAATDTLASLSERTVYEAMSDHVSLYIDAWAGTMGATAITSTFFSFELTLNPNRALVFGMGSVNPVTWREAKWEGTLKVSLEFDATTKAFLDAIIGAAAEFEKQVRIKSTIDANRIIQLDFAGVAEEAPELFTDEDGVVSLDFELKGMYNPALANWFEASVTNQVATLP